MCRNTLIVLLFFIIIGSSFGQSSKDSLANKDSLMLSKKELETKNKHIFWRIERFFKGRKIVLITKQDTLLQRKTNENNTIHKNNTHLSKRDSLQKSKKLPPQRKPTNTNRIAEKVKREKDKPKKPRKKNIDIEGNVILKTGIGLKEIFAYNNESFEWSKPFVQPTIVGIDIGVSPELAVGTDINLNRKTSFDPKAPLGGYRLTDTQVSFSLHGKLFINSLSTKTFQPYTMLGVNYILVYTYREYADGTPIVNPYLRTETTLFAGFVARAGVDYSFLPPLGCYINAGLGISWVNFGIFYRF